MLVVPFMEECSRTTASGGQDLAPNDFKLARSRVRWIRSDRQRREFSVVHGVWWPTSIVWGLLIGGLLAYTKSLGACVAAHFSSNLLLGIYVLYTRTWHLW